MLEQSRTRMRETSTHSDNSSCKDIISMGECLVEFTRDASGAWHAGFAGDAANTIVHAARLGKQCGFISSIGNDLFTSLIVDGLADEGIDLSRVRRVADRRNGLYFIESDGQGGHVFHYWRDGSAATTTLTDQSIDDLAFYAATARYFLVTGVTLAVMREHDRMIRLFKNVASSGTSVVLDSNYRPSLWQSPAEYRKCIDDLLPYVSIFLPSRDDIEQAWHGRELHGICREWSTLGPRTIAIKNGSHGAILFGDDTLRTVAAPRDVVAVDTTGAGDAFNAGFLAALTDECTVEEAVDAGQRTAAAAIRFPGAIGPRRT